MAAFILGLFGISNVHAELTAVGLNKSDYTSDFLIGNVAVSVIFVESDGTQDPNTETWDNARKNQVLSEIMSGLDWWTQQNTRSPLSFTYISQTVTSRYEPITRPYYDEALWIPEIMAKLGFSTGNRFISTKAYDNHIRTQLGTDWAFTIFVVDSLADSNGKFADGLFAYSYLGGPFMVMTYDNNGYGIGNMDVVAAHEAGHIFHALDQYAGASSPSQYSYGYFPTINGNHVYAPGANVTNSIMRGGIQWGIDNYTRQMVGWRDVNGNNQDDITDQTPEVTVNSQLTSFATPSGSSGYTGAAKTTVLPRQGNAMGYGLNLDTIAKVEYQVDGEQWVQANPSDGNFNSSQENFQIVVTQPGQSSALAVGAQDVHVRVLTFFSVLSGSGGSSGGSGAPASGLTDAHPYPNPFKPNSSLGHTNIKFSGLTDGAKIQIFSPAGEPVFDDRSTPGSSTYDWNVVDEDGKKISTGVYYYLITDDAGHKKEGKLAIIR